MKLVKQLNLRMIVLGLAVLALLAGCAQKKSVWWNVTKQSNAELRQNYLHVLHQEHVQVIKKGETIKLVFPIEHMFPYGSSRLLPAYRPVLNTAVNFINTYRTVSIKVSAYSVNQSNLKLTKHQAQTVASYLWSKGLKQTRLIYAVGYGAKHPVALNDTVIGRSYNRRVGVIFQFTPPYIPYH